MFEFHLSSKFQKKLYILGKKNRVLARTVKLKIKEIISNDEKTINRYKNLKKPMNKFKRIHLTNQFILLFEVKPNNVILFIDIVHRDYFYG